MALKSNDCTESSSQDVDSEHTDLTKDETANTSKNEEVPKVVKKKNTKQKLNGKYHAPDALIKRKKTKNYLPPHMHNAPVSSMPPHYPQYTNQILNCPVTINNWSSVLSTMHVPNNMYNVPYQQFTVMNPVPVLTSPVCSYATGVAQPLPPHMSQQPVVTENISSSEPVPHFSPEQIAPLKDNHTNRSHCHNNSTETSFGDQDSHNYVNPYANPIHYYLSLPKELFPSARMSDLDPNPIIDEFCKVENIHNHAPWIYDLEFGIPRASVTRQIATYNIKYRSINCKRTEVVHPGFDSCSQEFKRVLIYYYDNVVSSWYKGYVTLKYDKSVDNFQSWIHSPMQVLGMCWP